MVVQDQPGAAKPAHEFGHVAKLAPAREVENHQRLAVRQIGRGPIRAEMLEEFAVRIEKVVTGRDMTDVDHPYILALLPQDARHTDFRAERIAVGPDVGRHQETIVRGDESGERREVKTHGGWAFRGGGRQGMGTAVDPSGPALRNFDVRQVPQAKRPALNDNGQIFQGGRVNLRVFFRDAFMVRIQRGRQGRLEILERDAERLQGVKARFDVDLDRGSVSSSALIHSPPG